MVNQIIAKLMNYLSGFSNFTQKYMGNVELPKLHYSWLVVFFFIFVIFLVSLSLGRSRMLLALLSLYGGYFLESHFPYFNQLQASFKNTADYWLHLAIFFIFYIIIFSILNLSILRHKLTLHEASIFSVAVIAIFEIGFLASIILSYVSAGNLKIIPSFIFQYFGTKNAQFWWALAPLAAMVIFRRSKEPKT